MWELLVAFPLKGERWMRALYIIGAIIAFVPGALFIFEQVFSIHLLDWNTELYPDMLTWSYYTTAWIYNLVVAALAIVGCILGWAMKKPSGIFLLIAAGFSMVLGIYGFVSANPIGLQYSYFATWGAGSFAGITLEAIFIAVGGILCVINTVMLKSSKKA